MASSLGALVLCVVACVLGGWRVAMWSAVRLRRVLAACCVPTSWWSCSDRSAPRSCAASAAVGLTRALHFNREYNSVMHAGKDAEASDEAAVMREESGRQREQRLKESGRWAAFLSRVAELKAAPDCKTKPQRQAAWRTAVLEFAAPLKEPAPVNEPIDPSVFAHKPDASYASIITWVGDSIDAPNVRLEDCPAARAWSLLKEARKDRKWFFERVHSALAPSKKEQARKQQVALDDATFRKSLDEVRDIALGINEDSRTKLRASLIEQVGTPQGRQWWPDTRSAVDAAAAGEPSAPAVLDERDEEATAPPIADDLEEDDSEAADADNRAGAFGAHGRPARRGDFWRNRGGDDGDDAA